MAFEFTKPIYVTRPALPPLEDFCAGLKDIWADAVLTNNGPRLESFRKQLCSYCETENLSLFSNGTLALQLAIQALGLTGEVITTPFTFVATSHALYWNRIKPVFVDIDRRTYTISPEEVEKAITPATTAILGVHVYGNPCDDEKLSAIARKYNLTLMYDAAHAFGVHINSRPISSIGDVSMFSFHATKLFHTIEGGMLTFRDSQIRKRLDYLRNFGFENEAEVVMHGTNAKMNEVQALMGSLQMSILEDSIARRRAVADRYRERLQNIPGLTLMAEPSLNVIPNYSYFPIEINVDEFGKSRDTVYDELKSWNVFSRRYFYPLLTDLECYRSAQRLGDLSVARAVADCILTLPIYPDLSLADVDNICAILQVIKDGSRK